MILLFIANKKKSRRSKLSGWHILLFTSILLIALFYLFPQHLLIESLLDPSKAGPVSITYLRNLVKLYPNNVTLKLSLAEQLYRTGQVTEAKKIINPLMTIQPKTTMQWRILHLYYLMIKTQAYKLSSKDPMRFTYQTEMILLLPILVRSPLLSVETAEQLAEEALAVNQPKIALLFYYRYMQLGGKQSLSFYEKMAKLSLSIREYYVSSEFYFKAMEKSNNLEQKRFYFISGLKSLIAGGYSKESLVLARKYINGLAQDQATLVFLARLALSVNNLPLAQEFIKAALQLKYIQVD